MLITKIRSLFYLTTTGVLCLILTGCGTTQPSQYYILSSIEDIGGGISATQNRREKHIGLGPVNFPKYLDRSAIVVRQSDSEISINDMHRWAEPLEKNFTQVLAHNLQTLLNNYYVTVLPWRNAKSIDYQVVIDVHRFDADINNNVMLSVQWFVYRKADNRNLHFEKSIITEKAENHTYDALVKKQSEVVKIFSLELSDKLEEILRKLTES